MENLGFTGDEFARDTAESSADRRAYFAGETKWSFDPGHREYKFTRSRVTVMTARFPFVESQQAFALPRASRSALLANLCADLSTYIQLTTSQILRFSSQTLRGISMTFVLEWQC